MTLVFLGEGSSFLSNLHSHAAQEPNVVTSLAAPSPASPSTSCPMTFVLLSFLQNALPTFQLSLPQMSPPLRKHLLKK